MVLTRLQDNTPDIYSDASRDFQLLERLYDSVLNGTKYDIDSMLGVIDSAHCRSSLLPFLRVAVGFISTATYPDRVLRVLVSAFPYLIGTKGTQECVIQATKVYLKAFGVSGEVGAMYDKERGVLTLRVFSSPVDVIALSSFVQFFAPTGLKFSYEFTQSASAAYTTIGHGEDGKSATIGNYYGAGVRTGGTMTIQNPTPQKSYYMDKYISAVGSAVVALEEDTTYTEEDIHG